MRSLKQIKLSMPPLLACFITAATLTLSGCGSIPVPVDIKDEPLYFLKGTDGAVQLFFLTSGQTDLTRAQWDGISEGMVAMPASAWADFDREIGQLCSEVACNYVLLQQLKTLFTKIYDMNAARIVR